MALSDPLGDMLTRIRNGQRARMNAVDSPASRLRVNVLEVLKREGYIRGFAQEEVRPGLASLKIELKYHDPFDAARRALGQRGTGAERRGRGAVPGVLRKGPQDVPCR
jgi:ribosomal protein S8